MDCSYCGQPRDKHPVACFGCQTCMFERDHFICMRFEYPVTKEAPTERYQSLLTYLTDFAPGKPCAGWRYFVAVENSKTYGYLEPRDGEVDARAIVFVDKFDETFDIAAVFRATPHAGVYLRFRVRVPVSCLACPEFG